MLTRFSTRGTIDGVCKERKKAGTEAHQGREKRNGFACAVPAFAIFVTFCLKFLMFMNMSWSALPRWGIGC